MADLFGKLLGLAVAAGGIYAAGKYMKKYTDFKACDEEDIESIKANGEMVKEAAKRTYVSIKEKKDVKEAAGELKEATVNTLKDAGRIVSAAGTNTVNFVKEEKEKYTEDPDGYKENLKGSFEDIKENVKSGFESLKEDASGVFEDIKETAGDIKNDTVDFVKNFTGKKNGENIVEGEFTDVAEEAAETAEEAAGEASDACEEAALEVAEACETAEESSEEAAGVVEAAEEEKEECDASPEMKEEADEAIEETNVNITEEITEDTNN